MNLFDEGTDRLCPTSAGLHDQLARILEHETYSRLLAELSVPRSPLQRLLLRHPDDLFPKLDPEDAVIPEEFSISIPLLHWDSTLLASDDARMRPSIADFWDEEGSDDEGEEEEAEDLSDPGTMEELMLLQGLRLLQSNPHLLQLVQEQETLTISQVRKALGRGGLDLEPLEDEALTLMGGIAEQEGLGMIRTLLRRSDTDTESVYEIKKMVSEAYRFIRDLIVDLPKLAGELHRFLPVIAQKGAPFLQQHNAFVRWVYGTTSSDYLEALNALWELDLLPAMIVTLSCGTCKDDEDQPVCQVLSSDLSPNDLGMKPACSWCGGPLHVQGFYGLDKWVHTWIASQDRLLAYVVAYLLETEGIPWRSRIQTPKSEHDFHATTLSGDHLIECKVFRCSAPINEDRGLQRKVRDAISQLIAHAAEMQTTSATLVCYPCPFPEKTMDQWIAEGLKRNDTLDTATEVRVVGIDDLPGVLKGLSDKTVKSQP